MFLFRDLHPDLKEQLKELRKHLVESTNEMAPLKVWQLQGNKNKNRNHWSTFWPNFVVLEKVEFEYNCIYSCDSEGTTEFKDNVINYD